MKTVSQHRYHPEVIALELGYGLIGRPLMTVRCYLVGDTLIDCGQSHVAAEMKKFVRANPVKRLLLTHHHEDHSGNAALIAKTCGAAVLGHRITARKMQNIRPIMPYQHLVWGQSRVVKVATLPPLLEFNGHRFLAIHTPGHSKDHTVYLETQHGWLFSGDLYLGERIKFFRSDEKIDQQINSLKTVLQYDFDALFCSHNPVLKGGKKKLRGKLDFLEEIYGKVCLLLSEGLPEKEIVRRMDPKNDRFIKYFTMGNACFGNMIRSAIHAA
ncbi:MBL fold metallo-hydrolase [uncultured Desulfosarcina sp.]|uniref:MBL fold metallo-hydrolase n=1 Tax=uncultured Desulfosarcina sp. TaxID=218289 RepID=UPI0029C724CE|nr:MBL fold metallo-hydrolase [uncultured Desulfosarcina sp.]